MNQHASLNSLIELLNAKYQDLMLWYNYGVDRDSFIDHYEDGVYRYPVDTADCDITDKGYIFTECINSNMDEDEIKRRELCHINGKFYWVSKISTNIYRDKKPFFDFLCCYNFTDSVASLLTHANDTSQVMFNDPNLMGYNYSSDNRVDYTRSLVPLIKNDGVYIAQYKFESEDHAFIVIKLSERIIVINYYNGLLVVERDYYQLLGILLLLEQNDQDNRVLMNKLFAIPITSMFQSQYHVIGLVSCHYWPNGAANNDYRNYLRDVIKPHFVGREEGHVIDSLL